MIALLFVALLQGAAPVTSIVAAKPSPKALTTLTDKDGLICWKESVLGSRLKEKVCMRPSQARERAHDDRDLVEKAQTLQTIWDPASGPPP